MARAALVGPLILTLACSTPTMEAAKPEPEDPHPFFAERYTIKRFTTPGVYRIAWAAMEACSGLRTQDIDDWTFYAVESPSFRLAEHGDRSYVGLAVGGTFRRIYLAEPSVQTPRVVQHEMLHALGVWDEYSPLFALCEIE